MYVSKMKDKPKLITIVGPTASGKTSLSIQLAQKYNGEIISADSRQVYRGLDLGTGKITREEMCGIPHHLLDVAEPTSVYTVANFVHDGRKAINEIVARQHLPIIAGGTFLYTDALLGDVSTPEVPPNENLRKTLETRSLETLFSELHNKDPQRAQTIDRKNKRRLIRALEIVDALGVVPKTEVHELYDVLRIGIHRSKETLEQNIHKRLMTRLEHGMIEEVHTLHAQGLTYERMEELGLEYRYIARYLQGQLSYEDMVHELETKIRQYAKRQMTWLKRDTRIIWINLDNVDPESTDTFLQTFLK
jgi:tRNA dimethylallyltransferase